MTRERSTIDEVEIRHLSSADLGRRVDELVDLLDDAVEAGASVGFLAPLDRELAAAYWRDRLGEADRGSRTVLVAMLDGAIVGSVQLAFASQNNAAHRAEVQRLVVLRSAQRRGIGLLLMRELESVAASRGRTLILLNTRAGDPPQTLYARMGYRLAGRVPNYARNPDGTFNDTSIMYRDLSERSSTEE